MEDDVVDITGLRSLCFKLFKVMVKILDVTLIATKKDEIFSQFMSLISKD
jgi:hypothetical protein